MHYHWLGKLGWYIVYSQQANFQHKSSTKLVVKLPTPSAPHYVRPLNRGNGIVTSMIPKIARVFTYAYHGIKHISCEPTTKIFATYKTAVNTR
jgi:hypothetical protein